MVNIVLVGLGAIGREVAAALMQPNSPGRLLQVVDANPALLGRPLAELIGPAAPAGTVQGTIDRKNLPPRAVAMVTTSSRFAAILPTLQQCIAAGLHVVSSCEELIYPAHRNAAAAAILHNEAQAAGVAVLGVGVNPGFAMDALPLVATGVCSKVSHVRCRRSLDASTRRVQLQRKIGAALSEKQIRDEIAAGKLGHVGLAESVALLAAGLGWPLSAITETYEPVIARAGGRGAANIPVGDALGMHMCARGVREKTPVIELELTMAFGADSFDEIFISGAPPVTLRIAGGLPGDASTVNLLINAAASMTALAPGLRTMLDLLPLRCRAAAT